MARRFGGLFINPAIYAELSYGASTPDEVATIKTRLGLGYAELPLASLFAAGQAYKAFRQRGGLKTTPLPDFFTGVHAEASGLMLLTRDKSRYTTYFPCARLICL